MFGNLIFKNCFKVEQRYKFAIDEYSTIFLCFVLFLISKTKNQKIKTSKTYFRFLVLKTHK